MKKFVITLCLVLFGVLPAWAGLAENVSWIDNITGLKVVRAEEYGYKVKKDYIMTQPEREYNQVVQGLKKHGWRIIEQEFNDDAASMPDIEAIKDGMKLEVEVDREDWGHDHYKLEIRLKSYR